ncbi:MAG: hypothetical protein H6626_02085 [Pseudobdellovibrionaceae bacterium]|nr:hypothetical protein [Bdellovibrionales bacterium]USN47902.1 MAG: hypothetical protein H6626_02085 [Pseudobdellovibrionaceae bacterium]
MKGTKIKFIALALLLGAGLSGCQNYMEPISENPVTTGSEAMDVDLGLDAVNAEALSLEASIEASVSEIDGITNSDAFKVNFGSITSILLGDMQTSLRDVLGQLNTRLDKARTAIDKARIKIDSRLAMLSPDNPAHQLALSQIADLNDRLDHLEAKVDAAVGRVKNKAGKLIVKIDDVIKKVKRNPILNLLLRVALSQFRGGVAGIFIDLLGFGPDGSDSGLGDLVGLLPQEV